MQGPWVLNFFKIISNKIDFGKHDPFFHIQQNDVPLKSLTFQIGQTKWDGKSNYLKPFTHLQPLCLFDACNTRQLHCSSLYVSDSVHFTRFLHTNIHTFLYVEIVTLKVLY